jgi:hypothetical protein
MITNRGTCYREQLAIKTALEASSLFATTPVIAMDEADLETQIAAAENRLTAKGGKIGTSCIIWPPRVSNVAPDITRTVGGVTYRARLAISYRVTIVESLMENRNPTVGTGIPALTLAEAAAELLNREGTATIEPRRISGPSPISPNDNEDGSPDLTRLGYLLEVETEGWATALQPSPVNPGP